MRQTREPEFGTRLKGDCMDILIVGAGRGLGLGLAHHYANNGRIWMTSFSSSAPETLGASFRVDLRKEKEILQVVKKLKTEKVALDLVFFVGAKTPGLPRPEVGAEFGTGLDPETLADYFVVNSIGPLRFFELLFLAGLLGQRSTAIFFSSIAGSIEMRGRLPHNQRGGNLAYRLSKAALNCGVRNLAYDIGEGGPTLVCVHPGWVRTQSGGRNADTDVVTAVAKIVDLVESIGPSDHGSFFNSEGGVIPW